MFPLQYDDLQICINNRISYIDEIIAFPGW